MPARELDPDEATSSLGEARLDDAHNLVRHLADAEHAAQETRAVVRRERAHRLGRRLRIDPGEDEGDGLADAP